MSRTTMGGKKPLPRILPKFSLALQFAAQSASLPSRYQFRKWVAAALYCDAEIALRLVGAAEGRRLNRQFRGQDHATNVLTFVYPETRPLSGDIVLCVPVIASEARVQHKPLKAHYAHLVIHGMLHLQGYDHTHKRDAKKMEALESAIVTGLRYADPYQTPENGE
jgi:probable rRNA maturation factor